MIEFCGDGRVNNTDEGCDGELGCDAECQPLPLLVLSFAPVEGAEGVPIRTAIEVVFSQPLDPATVTPQTLRFGPIGVMDGVAYDTERGMDGRWIVDDAAAVFVPDRPHLQEYATRHHITVTSDVRTPAGGRLADAQTIEFVTQQVDPQSLYAVRNAEFDDLLDVYDAQGAAHLNAGDFTAGSRWWFTPNPFGALWMRNDLGGAARFLEGFDGSQAAFMSGGGNFTGEQWFINSVDARPEPGPFESPTHVHLSTRYQGLERSLGVDGIDARGNPRVSTQDIGALDQQWYLTNLGLHDTTDAVRNPANGHYYVAVDGVQTTWNAAAIGAVSQFYEGLQGHLVTITSPEEDAWLQANFDMTTRWLGGIQTFDAPGFVEPAGGWRWVTGEPFNYTNWNNGEPNNAPGNGEGEQWLSTWNNGRWNDNQRVWDYNPPNSGYIIEFTPPAGWQPPGE